MDLSSNEAHHHQPGNHRQQHQYVNDWHKAPSSRHTAAIDLSAAAHRPLAPVYHCNVPAVISQTQARQPSSVIVTADERQPFCEATPCGTWTADTRQQQLNTGNVAASDWIYEIPSDDDTLSSDDDRMLVIDEDVDSSVKSEIDSDEKGQVDGQGSHPVSEQEKAKILDNETEVKTEDKETRKSNKFKLKNFVLKKIFNNKPETSSKYKCDSRKEKLQQKNPKAASNVDVKQKQRENEVKARAEASPLNLIPSKSSKGDKNAKLREPVAAVKKSAASSSSEGLAVRSRPAKPEEHKYERKNSSREQNGKQTTCKSPPNKSRKEGKSHDSTKKPTVTSKNDEPEEMKRHRPEMSTETKQDGNKRSGAGKPVLSDSQLRRKFNCKKQVRIVLKRLTKEQIRQHTRPERPKLARIPKISASKDKVRKPVPFVHSKVDSRLEANALMNSLLGSAPLLPQPEAPKTPKVVFAPNRVVKRRKIAAAPAVTPAPEKQKGPAKAAVPSKTYPRELIGLIERDIQRAVPLERFINDAKRSPKIDWIVLDGKMQHGMTQRAPLPRKVNVRILMPPQYFVKEKDPEYEQQMKDRAAAIEEFKKKPPLKIKGVNTWPTFKIDPCCSEEDKKEFREKWAKAACMNFLKLYPTPTVGLERQKELLPNHWHTKILNTPFQIGKYLLRGVSPLSREYKYVATKFNKSCEQRVLAIDKVENPHLWFRYNLKREKLELRHPFAHELHLFHGTDKKYLDSILTYNLTWKYFGRKKGSRFGRGYYFSPLSSYAVHYTDQNPIHSIMLLFRVLTVKQCIGFEDSILPEEGFDTSISENGKVWVKFDVDEVYPDYVIHFAYSDPKDKDGLAQQKARLVKRNVERWKERYRKFLVWGSFRRSLHRKAMSWRKFYRFVKKWKPVKPKKPIKLRPGRWRGPGGRTWSRNKPVVTSKLKKPLYRSMSVWKQPKQFAVQKKVVGSYRAKKRFPAPSSSRYNKF